jgi:RNA polymerase sigma factor (sigma-70 family)
MKLSRVTVEDAQLLYNNQREFSKFVRENENFLRKLVHKYINKNRLNQNDSELFEDAKQEALLSLWNKALPKFNGSTKFSTFAFTVIKNDLMQFLQKKTKFEKETGETLSIENLKRNFN